MATIFCLTKQSRTALRLCCCFLKVILADGLFLFLFTCTAQDNNKVGRVLSSHNFLIVFGKRRIVRYWSTGVRWCKRDVPLFSKPCQEFQVLIITKYVELVNRCDNSYTFNYKKMYELSKRPFYDLARDKNRSFYKKAQHIACK